MCSGWRDRSVVRTCNALPEHRSLVCSIIVRQFAAACNSSSGCTLARLRDSDVENEKNGEGRERRGRKADEEGENKRGQELKREQHDMGPTKEEKESRK